MATGFNGATLWCARSGILSTRGGGPLSRCDLVGEESRDSSFWYVGTSSPKGRQLNAALPAFKKYPPNNPPPMSWLVYTGFQPGQLDFGWPVWLLIALWLSLPVIFYSLLAKVTYYTRMRDRRLVNGVQGTDVAVFVLGDLGHSPRMAYHVRSLVKRGRSVSLCGYLESALPEFLYDDDTVQLYEIPVYRRRSWIPFPVFAVYKVLAQCWDLTKLMSTVVDDNTQFVLLQNPPSIPLLAIAVLLQKTICPQIKIVVDWHNLNYSVLNLKYQNLDHPAVRLLRSYEAQFGKRADYHFTVTQKMKDYLVSEFKIPAKNVFVVYDRPADEFVPLAEPKHTAVTRLSVLDGFGGSDKLVVSSTSFTPDEDFGVFVEALKRLDTRLESRVFVVVTGKGPLQREFLDMVAAHSWSKNIVIKNVWLPIAEYPKLLQVADVGVSLHYSSSGLDLPMKIVDLFGCGVPVVSMKFPAISELVTKENGLVLDNNKDASELSEKIHQLLSKEKLNLWLLRLLKNTLVQLSRRLGIIHVEQTKSVTFCLELLVVQLGHSVGHNESRNTLVVGSGENDINFLKRSTSSLRVEEVDDWHVNEINDGKEQVASPLGLVDEDWSEHDNGKVRQPVSTGGDRCGHSSGSQCIDFRWIHPWKWQDCEGKEGNEQEETDSGTLSVVSVLLNQTSESNDESNTLTSSTDQEKRSSTQSVDKEEGWDGEHGINDGEDTTHHQSLSSGKVQSVFEQDSSIVDGGVTSSKLLEELSTGTQHHSSEILVLSTAEKLSPSKLCVIESVHGIGNHSGLSNNTIVVRIDVVDASQNVSGFLHSTFRNEPSWRLWQTKDRQEQEQGKQNLQSNWQSPRNRAVSVGQTEIDPVSNQSTNRNDRTFQVNQTTSVLWLGLFRLPHRNSSSVHTVTNTGNRSSNDEVTQLPVWSEWEDRDESTNDDDSGTDNNKKTSSETVTNNHGKQGTEETSNFVTSCDNTLDHSSVSTGSTDWREVSLKLWGGDNTTHKTLVISKQTETHHRGQGDCPSELSTFETKSVVLISEIPESRLDGARTFVNFGR
ncbi:hypothetical protein OGAPHI_006805 [Ogataea philodendri]|uniref:Chitobiosyldiphosphodolichol beta-mannosyltransferase n=1 Tax=Ogataea philodendri TaxID=1378263 RepID=A0A9P8T051_9ASCO|nr:uncharacterized protein OGAPHI_006805 [Ogataea philodendri]KAH3661398.1 hypothetical protein OGAPHI_006805 [Ogataea philodendri]